jgi:hypothetical protein
MRLLEDDASKRAALPALTALEDKAVWSNLKIRALAVICGLIPPPGSRRNPLRMNSRMDTRLPRPAARSGRPEGLQPAAPPPGVERPPREEAESGLEVIFPL